MGERGGGGWGSSIGESGREWPEKGERGRGWITIGERGWRWITIGGRGGGGGSTSERGRRSAIGERGLRWVEGGEPRQVGERAVVDCDR